MPKLDTLKDTFDTGIGAGWNGTIGRGTSWDAATKSAKLNINVNYNGTLSTSTVAPSYDLTASYLYAKLTLPALSSTQEVYFQLLMDGNNFLQMLVSSGSLICQKRVAGVTTTAVNIPYVAANHGPWWRIREAGGTVFFDVSKGGVDWTNLGSTGTPAFANTLAVVIQAGGGAGDLYGNLFVDYVNSFPYDSWVLLTGSKGATGPQLPAPSRPVRKYCVYWNDPISSGSFRFAYHWSNYSPMVGAGFAPLQASRNAQGWCLFQGLAYRVNADSDYPQMFYLPWDMCPAPLGQVRTTTIDINNQRARADASYSTSLGWALQIVDYAVNPAQGAFLGIECAWQTSVPTCWVDYGMKVDVAQAPMLSGQDMAFDYTVGPGQISGVLAGKPFTQVFTVTTTTRLTYIPIRVPGYGQRAFFYYDVAAQQFNHTLFWTDASGVYQPSGRNIYPDDDVSLWMGMAEQGQVMLALHAPVYSSGLYSPVTLVDRRFLMRGPLDTATEVPATS